MKKKPKEYTIKTMEDIFQMITIDNAENFLKDFHGVISKWLLIKEMAIQQNIDPKKISIASTKWIDDGKHIVTAKLIPKKKNK